LALHGGVPTAIRVHFDTARNLLLYAWFVYRFEPVAEMHAYASVEYALRLHARVPPRSKTDLKSLLAKAVRKGWIRDDGFRHYRRIVDRRAEFERVEAATGGIPAPAADPKAQSYVEILAKHLPEFRNDLAHGSGMLAPRGWTSLALCCDLINQLFAPR